jgi:hypothetical protein
MSRARLQALLLLLPLLGLLAACAAANPTVTALERAKALSAAGDHRAVAALEVGCAPRDQGCAQLHRIKADSCRRLAETSGAEASARRTALDCAVAGYDAALGAAAALPDAEVDPARATVELLDALARRRDLAPARADAQAQNARLREHAQAATRIAAARPAGLVFGADAALNAALLGADQGGCDAIATAAALLAEAGTPAPPLDARARSLDRAIGNARRARGCAA